MWDKRCASPRVILSGVRSRSDQAQSKNPYAEENPRTYRGPSTPRESATADSCSAQDDNL
jgi:hypothetical protein